jgi:DNA-binding transcriptional ArsR family regulator
VAGLEAVRATPVRQIHRDLAGLAARTRLPTWTQRLADGDRCALDQVARALHAWHDVAVRPFQEPINAIVDADCAIRARDGRLGGPERILAGLPPPLYWEPPVLLTHYPDDRDVYLDGRGLVLVPSFFCWRLPVTLMDPALPPVLVYPVEHDLDWLDGRRQGTRPKRALAALLGTTRAAVLDTVGCGPVTTTGIAERVRISAPSASEHAATRREAGLIVSRRVGNTVLHSLSKSGATLLDSPRR